MNDSRITEVENKSTDENYFALIAVILNEDMTVDEAIKYFQL